MLAECINFASHVAVKCMENPPSKAPDVNLPPVVLFTTVLQAADGTHELLTAGAVEPASIVMRSLLEANAVAGALRSTINAPVAHGPRAARAAGGRPYPGARGSGRGAAAGAGLGAADGTTDGAVVLRLGRVEGAAVGDGNAARKRTDIQRRHSGFIRACVF